MADTWWKGRRDPFRVIRSAVGFAVAGFASILVGPQIATAVSLPPSFGWLPALAVASTGVLASTSWALRNFLKAKDSLGMPESAALRVFRSELAHAYRKLIGLAGLPYLSLLLYFVPKLQPSTNLFLVGLTAVCAGGIASGSLYSAADLIFGAPSLKRYADKVDFEANTPKAPGYTRAIADLGRERDILERKVSTIQSTRRDGPLPAPQILLTGEELDLAVLNRQVDAISSEMPSLLRQLDELDTKTGEIGRSIEADSTIEPGSEERNQLERIMASHARLLEKLKGDVERLNTKVAAFSRLIAAEQPAGDDQRPQPNPQPGTTNPASNQARPGPIHRLTGAPLKNLDLN